MERFFRQQGLMEFLSTKQGNQELNSNLKNYVINKKGNSTLGLALYTEEIPVNSVYMPSYKLVYPYVEIDPDSLAERAGMRNGMRIVAVNRKLVNKDLKSFKEILDAIVKSKSYTEFLVLDSKIWDSLLNHLKIVDLLSVRKKQKNRIHFNNKKGTEDIEVVYNSKYKKIKQIGSGTFGRVFLVENILNKKLYALKVSLSSDEILYSGYSEEALILRKLKSPYVIGYEDFFTDCLNFFIVTEFCQDGDLGKLIEKKRQLKAKIDMHTAILLIKEIVYGIEFLHDNNIIHRDLKPGNIFLHNGHAKIGDLGLASMFDSKYMFTLAGTYFYMSPEMITSSGYDCKTDVWSVGIIAFEVFTLKLPFRGKDELDLKRAIVYDQLPDFDIRNDLRNLVKIMLQKNPSIRIGSKKLKLYWSDYKC